ncbi:MAG: MFS transporter, partial [Candidatus Pacearchaeota archaeon]
MPGIKKELFNLNTITRLGIIGLIINLSSACINTIWSIYINSFIDNISQVALITGLFSLLSFFSYFFFIPIIEKSDKSKMFIKTTMAFAILYILFAINRNLLVFLFLASIMTLTFTLRISSFGIIIKNKATRYHLSRSEGIVFTLSNIAWMIGPLIAGILSERFGFEIIFLLSAIFCLIAVFLFKVWKIDDKSKKKKVE